MIEAIGFRSGKTVSAVKGVEVEDTTAGSEVAAWLTADVSNASVVLKGGLGLSNLSRDKQADSDITEKNRITLKITLDENKDNGFD